MAHSDQEYWDNWERIVREQRKAHGAVIHNLINQVAEDTANMDTHELDELEGGLFV